MSDLTDASAVPQDVLARNRRLANGVLLAMVGVWLTTYAFDASAPVLLIRAMSEAGMIGGLADWFAVTALFRHPLGLPIPHTALLPKNQARAAQNVGDFFRRHFLTEDQVRVRVEDIGPTAHITNWLGRRENALVLARHIVEGGAALLTFQPSRRILARARAWARRQALTAGSDAAIAGALAGFLKSGLHSRFAGDAIGLVQQAIDQNRDAAIAIVQENSRWWIASTIDRRVADLVVNAVIGLLDDLRHRGPLRDRLETGFDTLVDQMEAEGVLAGGVAEARRAFVASGAFDDVSERALTGFRDAFARQVADNPDSIAAPMADLIQDLAARLCDDQDMIRALDTRIAALAGRIVGEASPQIAAYVTDVIAGWEPAELNARFEEEIGPDLQFIRINGAILGALIGGALFAMHALLG